MVQDKVKLRNITLKYIPEDTEIYVLLAAPRVAVDNTTDISTPPTAHSPSRNPVSPFCQPHKPYP